MKYSQFNSILPYEDKFILHNTFTNHAIVLDPVLKDLIEAARHEGVDGLNEVHPSLFDALCKQDFLLDTSVDEVEKVKKVRDAVDFAEDAYHLTINPTMNCNFKCWYCYETHIKASRMNEEISDRVNKFLSAQIEKNEKLEHFVLSWFGGEPLLYYEDIVLPIIKHFNKVSGERKIDTAINFTSNGFLITDEMVKSFKDNRVNSLQITLDGYGPEHDKVRYVSKTRGSYEKIIENVLKLVKAKIYVRLRINFTSINIVSAHNIIDDIQQLTAEERQYIGVDFHRVWQDTDDGSNDWMFEKQMDTFRKAGFIVASNMAMNNVRDSCYADKKNSAVINYNGDVFKCTARDFTTFHRDGYIDENGELIWENDSLNKRMNAKFKNRPCLSCRLLPVCNGGCSQHAVENVEANGEYCVHQYDEKKKDQVVLDKIKGLLAVTS
jgi:uncharacterized protein